MTRILDIAPELDSTHGDSMTALAERLFHICRSITGQGLRETLDVIGESLPLERHEVASGTRVFDWEVPNEWNIRDAYVADAHGRRVIDFRDNNLHVVNYSIPFRGRMTLEELRPRLHTLPDHPEWIPYRTSYYRADWGFCLRHRDLEALPRGEYDVVIDASLEPGHLSYGELYLPGETDDEILLTTHVCHPSMANDNVSGIVVLTLVASLLAQAERRHSIRVLFVPGTIGAITWLARNRERVERIAHGLVLAGLGDSGPLTYKRTRQGDADVDRAVEHVLEHRGGDHRIVDFSPYGYDERQYNSPGFALPVGRLSRSEYASYPEYHTSADDLDFISAEALLDSARALLAILGILDCNARWINTAPFCEPQLGKRGLYDEPSDRADWQQVRLGLLWALNLSDGRHDALTIARRAGMPFEVIDAAVQRLASAGLLQRPTDGPDPESDRS